MPNNGRFLELVNDRIVFANSANRDQSYSSKLTVGKKMVGKQEVRNVRFNAKIVTDRVPVVIPGCDDACARGTEQLVADLGFSGSVHSRDKIKQMVVDLCYNVVENIDDYLDGWNLTSASTVVFNSTTTE